MCLTNSEQKCDLSPFLNCSKETTFLRECLDFDILITEDSVRLISILYICNSVVILPPWEEPHGSLSMNTLQVPDILLPLVHVHLLHALHTGEGPVRVH